MKIKFTINKYRKDNTSNNFNPRLSSYWQSVYYGLFKEW